MKQKLKVGDHGYVRQFTGNYYVDLVKRPYTVIEVTNSRIKIQEARCIFPIFHYDPSMSDYYKKFDGTRPCFYDTVAESIEPDDNGHIEELTWHPKKGLWGTSRSSYPSFFIAGNYEHYPYLN